MRSTLSALVIAAGLFGFGAAAQATPLSAAMPLGVADVGSGLVPVQMTPGERRVMRHRVERRMMRRRMERRMMRRHMERRMMRREMRGM